MKRSWKKLAGVLLTGLMLMGLTGCGGEEAKNESKGTGEYAKLKTVELIGADSSGKGAAAQQFGELVAKNVDKITGGKLKIDYHPTRNWAAMKTCSVRSNPMISRSWWPRWHR